MMEYSKSVSAANLVHNKKTISRTQTQPQYKLTSTLDEELAKILQVHEEETQRIASLFLS
ncbi:unnamed protein product [Hymenolepis diminuta]|nr:unnamed protein product [Hymenolepis diminuta]